MAGFSIYPELNNYSNICIDIRSERYSETTMAGPFGWYVTKLFSCGFQYFNHSLIRKVFKPELNLIHSCSCSHLADLHFPCKCVIAVTRGAPGTCGKRMYLGITFLLVIYCCLLMIYIIYGFRTSVTTVICIEIPECYLSLLADARLYCMKSGRSESVKEEFLFPGPCNHYRFSCELG